MWGVRNSDIFYRIVQNVYIRICTRHHVVESAECILLSCKTFWVLHCLIFCTDYSFVLTAYIVVNIRHSAVESAEYVRLSDKTLWVSQSLIYSTDCSIVPNVYSHTLLCQMCILTPFCAKCVFSRRFVPSVYSCTLHKQRENSSAYCSVCSPEKTKMVCVG